ncbi:MAG TPA: GntR family transcriptional regulator [Streptosporangiaceae bacterium]|jgi:DNA-binding GntR family transcriptional regulator
MTIDRLGGPDKISAVRSDSLREQVTRALEAAVVAGELQPGVIYSAPTLAERFHVSATPVREAMLDLVGEGMVEAVRNRGFRVVEVSEADLDQISQIRLLIEVPIMSQVAKLLTPDRIAALNETGEAIEAAAERGDLIDYLDCDRRFHAQLIATIGNPRLTDLVDRMRRQARLFGLQQLADGGQLLASAREHRGMLKGLQSGDVTGAESLMTAHIGHTRGLWVGRSGDEARPG